MAQQCCGWKKDGVRCSVMVLGEVQHIRCKTHMKTLEKVGPNQIRRDELKYVHDKIKNDAYILYMQEMRGMTEREILARRREHEAYLREETIRFQTELHALETTIDRETEANGGHNADGPYIERRREAVRAAHAARHLAWQQRNAAHQEHLLVRQQAQILQQIQAANGDAVLVNGAGGELANLANDRQNVHTNVVVQKVKETVQKVLQIHVPPEYQTETLKTSGEIILECGLSRQSAWQMMAKYCSDEDIYEMGRGIYARVLNSVWQFIKASPDASDLKKILASEMRDNIGMCAQGNLSRLCNILSGYLDGINLDLKSKNEMIGERLAPLMQIDDIIERLRLGALVLDEFDIPLGDDRIEWLNPLVEL